MRGHIIWGRSRKFGGLTVPGFWKVAFMLACSLILGRSTLIHSSAFGRRSDLIEILENSEEGSTKTLVISPNEHTPGAVIAFSIKPDKSLLKFMSTLLLLRLRQSLVKSSLIRKIYMHLRSRFGKIYLDLPTKSVIPSADMSTDSLRGGETLPKKESETNLFLNQGWNAVSSQKIFLRGDVAIDLLTKNIGEFYPGPRGIHLAILNLCNLECVMCPYHSPKYKQAQTSGYFSRSRMMKSEIFERILGAAITWGSSLQFGQIEEALIHPKAIEWMSLAKSRGVTHVHLTTNGTLLEGKRLIELARAEIDSIMFSLDAVDADKYLEIRGDDLEKVEANIANFLRYISDHNLKKPTVWVSFILQEQSRQDRDLFLSKWTDLGADRVTFYALSDIDPVSGRVIRTDHVYERTDRYACASPWEQCVIYPDGEVSLCCQSMLETGWRGIVSMGSLEEQSLEQIWTGKLYTDLRTDLLQNTLDPQSICAGCDLWSAGTYFVEESELFRRVYNETSDTIEIKTTRKNIKSIS